MPLPATRLSVIRTAPALLAVVLVAAVAVVPTPPPPTQDPRPVAAVRSALYPTDWRPVDDGGTPTTDGRFLHDFSYAGYARSSIPIPATVGVQTVNVVTDSRFGADNTGATDTTARLQAAIDHVGSTGGGVVFLPAGTYRVRPQGTNTYALAIRHSRVILRGAGAVGESGAAGQAGVTYLFNDQPVMSAGPTAPKRVIVVSPNDDGNLWYGQRSGFTPIPFAVDELRPTRQVRLANLTGLAVGDTVMLGNDNTTAFRSEHGMSSYWPPTSVPGIMYHRVITAINTATKTVTIDIPTRYPLKLRDNARLWKTSTQTLFNVGVERLSIGMAQNTRTNGTGSEDYTTPGTLAYEVTGSAAIRLAGVKDGWVTDVSSYRPTGNTSDLHLLSNGVALQRSTRGITVRNVVMQKPQYRGGGGNGYLFILAGMDALVRDSLAVAGRHNYQITDLSSSGNVVLRCTSRNGSLNTDFHRYLSHANLFDGFVLDRDQLETFFRGATSDGAGTTGAQSVFWNTNGLAGRTNQTHGIRSEQYGWGYVIGTRGPTLDTSAEVIVGTNGDNTGTPDFREAINAGADLVPQSLYDDQLFERVNGRPTNR